MLAEPKLKKAKTVEINPHLSVDSPKVSWFVESLEGITSEELEGIVDAPGGGGSGKIPISAHMPFVAVCWDVFHPPKVPGALEWRVDGELPRASGRRLRRGRRA